MRHSVKRHKISKHGLTTQDVVVGLTRSFILSKNNYIITGVIKAKLSKVFAEKIITIAKKGILRSIRDEVIKSDNKTLLDTVKTGSLHDLETKLYTDSISAQFKSSSIKGDLRSRRRIISILKGCIDANDIASQIFARAFEYIGRNGGYTRAVRYSIKKGDASYQSALCWV